MRRNDGDALLLAGRAGRYDETEPADALRAHFRCAWTNAIPAHHSGPVAVVPDGCVDLIWRDGTLRVAGPDVTAATPLLHPGTTIVGMRFQPGAARHWLRLPLSEIVGQQVDLADLWGRSARELSEAMAEAPTVEARAERLQAGVLAMLPDVSAPARDAAHIFHALHSRAAASAPAIDRIVGRLDTSARTLRRRCYDHFGYGPKTLDRILRFQRFIGIAAAPSSGGLAAMAYAAGYADQAHLSREARVLSGFSARSLARQFGA